MLGAITGDIVGSIYEADPIKTTKFPLFGEGCVFTDDTVMTVAVASAVMHSYGRGLLETNAALIKEMQYWGKKYPAAGYGRTFRRWLREKYPLPYGSYGNGSAMRVSAVGWLFPNMEETELTARRTASVTHNHPEGVKGAIAVACAIYLLRNGAGKEETKRFIEENYNYDFSRSIAVLRPDFRFDYSCQGTVPAAMTAFFESADFEDALRLAVSLGGDSDTLAAIAGSIAEAYYGIPQDIQEKTLSYMDEEMLEIYQEFLEMRQ